MLNCAPIAARLETSGLAAISTIVLVVLAHVSSLIIGMVRDPERADRARWSQSDAAASINWPSDLKPLAVDRQELGYFPADPPQGLVAELPRSLVREGEIYVLALRNYPRVFDGAHRGFRVIVGNATSSPIRLLARESSPLHPAQLAIVQEARDPFGRWIPVEYLRAVWCHHSWQSVWLQDGRYLDLDAPHYTGGFATRMRIAVRLTDSLPEPFAGGRIIYSNEFAGRIDLRQLVSPRDAQVSVFAE